MIKRKYTYYSGFYEGMFVGLLLCVIIPFMTCLVRPSYAQSGFGVGLVTATPQAGGLNVSYKGIQVFFAGISGRSGDVYVHAAVRYNHSVRDWKRMRFKVFGQVSRHGIRNESDSGFTSRYLFTGGGSAQFRIGGKPSPNEWFLSLDIELSIDDLGKLGTAPARGAGIHVFF